MPDRDRHPVTWPWTSAGLREPPGRATHRAAVRTSDAPFRRIHMSEDTEQPGPEPAAGTPEDAAPPADPLADGPPAPLVGAAQTAPAAPGPAPAVTPVAWPFSSPPSGDATYPGSTPPGSSRGKQGKMRTWLP